jgi:hypothetical protein
MRPTGKWSPRRKGAGRLSARTIAVTEKRAEAVRLRIAGETFHRIAKTLGVAYNCGLYLGSESGSQYSCPGTWPTPGRARIRATAKGKLVGGR